MSSPEQSDQKRTLLTIRELQLQPPDERACCPGCGEARWSAVQAAEIEALEGLTVEKHVSWKTAIKRVEELLDGQ
jgi:hypothetical protein